MAPPLFKADKRNLGQYLPVNRETRPELFRDPATTAQSAAEAAAAFDRLIFRAVYGDDAAPAAPEDVDPEEIDLSDSDCDEGTPAPTADASDIDDCTWKVGIPKTQPLTYAVPTNKQGGKEWHQIKFNVDFNSAVSVDKANRARRQGLYRAGKSLGLPLKRARTDDKPYTQENEDWIAAKYDEFAAANGNKQMPMRDLYNAYVARFPNPERTQSSLTSFIYRKLQDKKNEYRP